MKKLVILFCVFSLFGCQSEEGKDLARKYCKCVMDSKGDIYSVGECEEIFADELKALEQKPRVKKDFMEEMEKCQ